MRRFLNTQALVLTLVAGVLLCAGGAAGEDSVTGKFIGNDQAVQLDFVYVYEKEHPFDEARKAYTFCFTDKEVPYKEIEDLWMKSDHSYVEVTVGDDREALGQNLRHVAMDKGNVSGTCDAKIAFDSFAPPHFKGRVLMAEAKEFFGATYRYEAAFEVTIPEIVETGTPLPAGGGEPGAHYLKFIKAVASGDIEKIKAFAPNEEARAEMDGPEAAEMVEMLQMMTPSEVEVLGGTIDGDEALLDVKAVMDGETMNGEITMVKTGELWLARKMAWKG